MKPEIGIENTQEGQPEGEVKGKAEKKAGKRIGYNYIIIKSLKESKKNDVVKCLYIKSLTKWGFCVIKEGTYGDTKDVQGRDIRDRLIWQQDLHKLLQDKVRLPKFLGSFEENGNYYLVIEYMRGRSLAGLIRKKGKQFHKSIIEGKKDSVKFLGYLAQIITILETLHKHDIVHRDVTVANFMINEFGKVSVIDMELSYSLAQEAPNPPFQLGTHGFMSPQQEVTMAPTIYEDIFSIGAILLMVWTGVAPNKMIYCSQEALDEKVRFIIQDKEISNLTIACLQQKEPEKRPALKKIKETLLQYQADLSHRIPRQLYARSFFQKEHYLEAIRDTLAAYNTPLFVDEKKGWFSDDTKNPSEDKNVMSKTWYAGFYNGCAGTIYLLGKLKGVGIDVSALSPAILNGLDLIEKKYILNEEEPSSGLFYGGSGVACALIAGLEEGIIDLNEKYRDWAERLLSNATNYPSIIQGIAGHCLALLFNMNRSGFKDRKLQVLGLAQQLLNNQEPNGSWQVDKGEKNGRVIYGFGHGMAGIVYALLEVGYHLQDSTVLSAAERGLHWLMQKAIQQNDSFDWKSFSGKKLKPWWCEGGMGIALTFLKAWKYLGDPTYRKISEGALRIHPEEVYHNNLSQCHGLSGLGEIYLEAFEVLQEEEWFQRANWIAQVVMRLKRIHPRHGSHWLVEAERNPSAGFMTGNSGVLHFLLRSSYPEKFGLPLLGEANRMVRPVNNSMLITSPSKIERV